MVLKVDGACDCTIVQADTKTFSLKVDGTERKYGTVFLTCMGYQKRYFWMQVVGIQVFYESIYFKRLFILIDNIK